MKILLVHWDKESGRGLRQALQRMGHAVILATDDDALRQMVERRPDVIFVQADLIEVDGRRLFDKEITEPLPPLVVIPSIPDNELSPAAVGSEANASYASGHLRMAARLLRHLRRLFGKDGSRLRVGNLVIDSDEKRVLFHGQPLQLTPLQFTLLSFLARQPGRVFSPGELLEGVWGSEPDDAAARELLKVHVRRLRQKMYTITPDGARYIQSVRGFGYRLAPPEKR